MDTTSYVAVSRQIALQRAMTSVANNIANANSTGFRAEHALFEPYLAAAGEPKKVAFVQDVGLYRDPSPGTVDTTGNPLDLAIVGPGYLTFQTPQGERYARAGHLAIDADGQLVDARGNPLLDDRGSPVVVPQGERQITVAEDGTITGSQGGGPIARLQLVTFGGEQDLTREGDGLYRASAVPRPIATGRIVQGALERSNVSPVQEMTTMMMILRAFQGTEQLIEAQDELDRRAIDRLVAVGG
jgi:flagellar basal-body rod protein FlgF